MYLRRELNKDLTLFKDSCFAYKAKKRSFYRYKVTVGVGGNVGDVRRRFKHLFEYFKKDKRVDLLQTSLILKNPPFGFANQDDFFNSIFILKTNMQPLSFLNYLHRVEKKFARLRSFANAPRTLDLDIIFFDDRIVNTPRLQIPHVDWHRRQSVVIPLEGLK
jgi:2-amino-4-hydroxy-6-hydroxymethyldihydropteridine diphosphokinase